MLTDVSFISAYVFSYFSCTFQCCRLKGSVNEVSPHPKPLLESSPLPRYYCTEHKMYYLVGA